MWVSCRMTLDSVQEVSQVTTWWCENSQKVYLVVKGCDGNTNSLIQSKVDTPLLIQLPFYPRTMRTSCKLLCSDHSRESVTSYSALIQSYKQARPCPSDCYPKALGWTEQIPTTTWFHCYDMSSVFKATEAEWPFLGPGKCVWVSDGYRFDLAWLIFQH